MTISAIWIIVAFLCIGGIILALLQVNRIMDYSNTFFSRWKKDDRGDEGGVWTVLDAGERAALESERHRQVRAAIPEAGLRADLPTGTTDEQSPGLRRDGSPARKDEIEPPPFRYK